MSDIASSYTRCIDELRQPWESGDMWLLRKSFMQKHWGNVNMNRLICLAQIFVNVEFMGCRYGSSVMEEVAHMAAGLAEERRKKRYKILERTFGKCSVDSSAEKGHIPGKQLSNYKGKTSDRNKNLLPIKHNLKRNLDASANSEDIESKKLKTKDYCSMTEPVDCSLKLEKLKEVSNEIGAINKKITPMKILNMACHRCKCNWEVDIINSSNEMYTHVWLSVDGVLITHLCHGIDSTAAKQFACEIAIETLTDNLKCEVRPDSFPSGNIKCSLYSKPTKRMNFKGPEFRLYKFQCEQLALVRTQLLKCKPKWASAPDVCLRNSCTFANSQFEQRDKKIKNWKRHFEIFVAGTCVVQFLVQGWELPIEKEAENWKCAYNLAIENINKVDHKIVEHEDVLKLNACDKRMHAETMPEQIEDFPGSADSNLSACESLEIAAPFVELGRRLILLKDVNEESSEKGTVAKKIIMQSCGFSKLEHKFDLEERFDDAGAITYWCTIRIDGAVVLRDHGPCASKKQASIEAARIALQFLSTICFTLLRKGRIDSTVTQIGKETLSLKGHKPPEISQVKDPSNNMSEASRKMMLKMGWKGGGIGKTGQGISEPITVREVFQRQGLGMAVSSGTTPQFVRAISTMLQEYGNDGRQTDLVFSSEFDNAQRKKIHNLAHKFKLKSISYGKADNRQITVRKDFSATELLSNLLGGGGEDGKYSVVFPTALQK